MLDKGSDRFPVDLLDQMTLVGGDAGVSADIDVSADVDAVIGWAVRESGH